MFTRSWIRKLFARTPRTVRKAPPRPRPALEALEDRTVPATFTVNNLANLGPGSLRAAVAAANANPGHDDVSFAAGLSGTITVTTGRIGITDSLTITGPGAAQLRVIGQGSPVFGIPRDAQPVSITGLKKVQDGRPKAKAPILESVTPVDSTTLMLQFNASTGRGAARPASYVIPGLAVQKAEVISSYNRVILTTSPQDNHPYSVFLNNLRARNGAAVRVPGHAGMFTGIQSPTLAPPAPPADTTPPRVVGAISTSNTSIVVAFSEPVADTALNPANYAVRQSAVNPDAGLVVVTGARFANADRTIVELTTLSQNDLAYTLRVVNLRDDAGNVPALPTGVAGVGLIDPTLAALKGTAPAAGQIIDSDGDGLSDNVEQRGWVVTYTKQDGTAVSYGVSSDPMQSNSDGDGLNDRQELALTLDPRSADTDQDQLSDSREFNEVYSNPAAQDSDRDGLNDALEFEFYRTSPVQADTDGDQLPDGEEVLLANRNARVADLPTPAIEVGDMNLALDVRFTQTTSQGTTEVESRTVDSTLQQNNKKEQSNSNSNTQQAMVKLAASFEFENTTKFGTDGIGGGVKNNFKVSGETGWTGSWTSSYSNSSVAETQQKYGQSLSTNAQVNQNASVSREVRGARMSVTVFLKNASSLAYNVQNLQITAFLQDPQSPGSLTPLATLLPQSAPAGGFTLGPLVPERGPFIFASDTIFASQVEALMKNPTGVVFKIANFDITDELGRNFAFTSKDIFDRTSSLVIDYGGFDSDRDGEGDLTENHRVATDGGRVIDTNGNGQIDAGDRRVIFDANGKQVGLSLRHALEAIGLKHFDERANPTAGLTDDQLRGSYSTVVDADGIERLARVRTVGGRPGERKAWVVLTPTGIDPSLGLDNTILTPASDVKLAFVQDLDGDLVPAAVEAIFGTSDGSRDTDADSLDDRFESLIGWDVELGGLGSLHVFSQGGVADTDGDGLGDRAEAPEVLTKDSRGLITRADRGPAYQQNGTYDVVTDPSLPDSDRDGVADGEEVNGYPITLRNGTTVTVTTNPMSRDTDGDTASDGTERRLGGNPTDPTDRNNFADDDGDGLANVEETTGYQITVTDTSATAFQQGARRTITVTSHPGKADSDGDGLTDLEERQAGTNPSGTDSDGDGLTDSQERRGFQLRDQGIIKTDPLDADTDNDLRSDGAEAELTDVEANRWVVRPVGKAPYRVYSDPLQADADFDSLADGQEFNFNGGAFRSDPNKGDTDGDGRNDGQEFAKGTNPLVEDFQVTVFFNSLTLSVDGDGAGGPGDIGFDLGIRKPDNTQPAGLSSQFTSGVQSNVALTGPFQSSLFGGLSAIEAALPALDPGQTQQSLRNNGADIFGISFDDGATLRFATVVPQPQRSISFSMTKDDFFAIEGVVMERDGGPTDTYVYLGGLDGVRATELGADAPFRPIFKGSDLLASAALFRDLTFNFGGNDNIAGGSERIAGSVSVSFIIS